MNIFTAICSDRVCEEKSSLIKVAGGNPSATNVNRELPQHGQKLILFQDSEMPSSDQT